MVFVCVLAGCQAGESTQDLQKRAQELAQELIIVDDASTDGTQEVLKKINDRSIRVFYHKKNMGKGAAIRTALKHIRGSIVLIQDADLEYNPKEYPSLIKPILEGKAKVVYGSRLLGKKSRYSFPSRSHTREPFPFTRQTGTCA